MKRAATKNGILNNLTEFDLLDAHCNNEEAFAESLLPIQKDGLASQEYGSIYSFPPSSSPPLSLSSSICAVNASSTSAILSTLINSTDEQSRQLDNRNLQNYNILPVAKKARITKSIATNTKEKRKAQNRQSAVTSRKKKSDRLKSLVTENEFLKHENIVLKKHLQESFSNSFGLFEPTLTPPTSSLTFDNDILKYS